MSSIIGDKYMEDKIKKEINQRFGRAIKRLGEEPISSWEGFVKNEVQNELPRVFVQDAEDDIVQMCRTLLTQERAKLRKKIEEMRCPESYSNDVGFNQAINDIIDLLK